MKNKLVLIGLSCTFIGNLALLISNSAHGRWSLATVNVAGVCASAVGIWFDGHEQGIRRRSRLG